MSQSKSGLHGGKSGTALAVRVIPRASRNEVVEVLQDGSIKIRLNSPPVEGRANQALIEFLAEKLEIPRTKIEIVAGQKGRNKLVAILDLDAGTVERRLFSKYSRD